MIITVTPNPALDLTWHVAEIVHGGTHRAEAGRARAGGKGLNVARVAHAQGAPVTAITTAGGATGEEFAAELDAAGVPHVLVPVTASTRRSIALVDETRGDTTIVNEYGVAPSDAEWGALQDAVGDALADAAGVLVISGSLPPGAPDGLLPALIAQGREAGAIVIADTSGPALLAAADAGASVLKPNEHELGEATGLEDPVDGARELLRRGAELVLVSLGAEGMLAVSAASGSPAPEVRVLHARLHTALAGNPTGAGDAGVAACAVLMDAGIRDPEQILRRATAWSAAAVLMPLAGDIHPTWPDLEAAVTVTTVRPSRETSHSARDRVPGVQSHAEAEVSTGSRPASDPKDSR